MTPKSEILRHYLASIAYHITKVIKKVPSNYINLQIGHGVRTPLEILNHINRVLCSPYQFYKQSEYPEIKRKKDNSKSWGENIKFLYFILDKLDNAIATVERQEMSEERILQGPLSDVMTHIGQLAMMRRIAGAPVQGENFFIADIQIGVVGPNQPDPVSSHKKS